MKKLLSIAIVAILLVGVSTPSFAKDNKHQQDSQKENKQQKENKKDQKQGKKGTLVLATDLDSLNYAFGVANGMQFKSNFVQNDSTFTPKDFLRGIEDALKCQKESDYYFMGFQIGAALSKQQNLFGDSTLNWEMEVVRAGLEGAVKGDSLLMTEGAVQAVISEAQARAQQKQQEAQQKQIEAIKETNLNFLKENATKDCVHVTESGLQYLILQEGNGVDHPTADDTVKVHYHGTLVDGTVFDSSVDRGEPIEFPVNGVIKGWTEALQMMTVGSKWKLFLPYTLAYGEQGIPQSPIGPYATLIFEVELLGIIH